MSFLYCKPTVFVIGNDYEILINLSSFGICYLKVGDSFYYEKNSGVLPSERKVLKIRVPQSALDKEEKYSIIFRERIVRGSYVTEFKPTEIIEFAFKPLKKVDNINIYHVADVHGNYDLAVNTASYFEKETDLFIVNGDIAEFQSIDGYLELSNFLGDISGGKIPVILTRGNHDVKGALPELYETFFPCPDFNAFYEFNVGVLTGVALDLGEDKVDSDIEYDRSLDTPVEYLGKNRFHEYRERELEFLRSVSKKDGKICFAVSHINPFMTTKVRGNKWDIERELYGKWCAELERIGVKFMLTAHYHQAFIMNTGDERSLHYHSYPAIVGSARIPDEKVPELFIGTALTLFKDGKVLVKFTDQNHSIKNSYEFNI